MKLLIINSNFEIYNLNFLVIIVIRNEVYDIFPCKIKEFRTYKIILS